MFVILLPGARHCCKSIIYINSLNLCNKTVMFIQVSIIPTARMRNISWKEGDGFSLRHMETANRK